MQRRVQGLWRTTRLSARRPCDRRCRRHRAGRGGDDRDHSVCAVSAEQNGLPTYDDPCVSSDGPEQGTTVATPRAGLLRCRAGERVEELAADTPAAEPIDASGPEHGWGWPPVEAVCAPWIAPCRRRKTVHLRRCSHRSCAHLVGHAPLASVGELRSCVDFLVDVEPPVELHVQTCPIETVTNTNSSTPSNTHLRYINHIRG